MRQEVTRLVNGARLRKEARLTFIALECDKVGSAIARIARALAFLVPLSVFGAPLPSGKTQLTLDVNGIALDVYAYKPQGYAGGGLLLTLHGVGRNASGYRDHAIPLADRHGYMVVAPLFDRARFPTWRYQHGGVVRTSAAGELNVEAEAEWTGRLLIRIVEVVRSLEGAPDLAYLALGHSGGGQALSRVAALMPTGARRIVIANAGTYLWPSRDARFPDGYAGLPLPYSSDEALRRYLAQPLTLLLGTADVKQDADLSMRPGAAAQGANRYERGTNAFRAAQALAHARGWDFNWKVVEVPGVGHSAARMFRNEQTLSALQP
jgi:poly(3-hydroxybutyrate) depolymerase